MSKNRHGENRIFSFKKIARHGKAAVGIQEIKRGWNLIGSLVRSLHRPENQPDRAQQLRDMTFDELLDTWNIPKAKVPFLKKMLMLEMGAFLVLTILCLASAIYGVFYSFLPLFAVLMGSIVGMIAILQFLCRHHWYTILSEGKYKTFWEYLF